ncbi:MAG: c-type cytochrome [Flavobacteriales bacterium]|nr:c-type cytochrome [Flavobacteriales bacterium]
MRDTILRTALTLFTALAAILPASAQYGAASVSGLLSQLENPSKETLYLLMGMAILQVVIIVTLAGVMKALGSKGSVWVNYLRGRKAGVLLVLAASGLALDAQALSAAATPQGGTTAQELFWYLFIANIIFFIIIVAELTVLKGMVRTIAGKAEEESTSAMEEEPAFVDTLLQKLTKRPSVEKEKDLVMHHEYDGIRELDNVLPPWWVWLFYATIIWGVIYLVNVHVINVWPDQDTAYEQEMTQAEADIKAYLAQQAAVVDENTVTRSTDAATLATGRKIFTEFCKACHGDLGEGNAVGPNLTDVYWIHGGSINDIFRTIKYGVPAKGMQSWKSELRPQEIQAVASYIMSLQGTDPPNAKAPEGEPYVPKEAGNDAAGEGDGTEATDGTVAVAR